MGPSGFLGGVIIGSAVYLVLSDEGRDLSPVMVEDCRKDEEIDERERSVAEEGSILEENR